MPDQPTATKARQDVTILQVVPRLQSGGAEQSTCEIAAGLVQAGARSLVASAGGRLEERLRREGSQVLKLPADSKNPLRMATNVLSLCMFIRSYAVSLIHARSRAPAWSALAAARICGIPFVTTYHGAHSSAGTFKRAYNGIMARGDVTITNSQYMADQIRKLHSIDDSRFVVIHRGVDLSTFNRTRISHERIDNLRRTWGVAADTSIVLVPARLSPRKGQELVVRAIPKLLQAGGARPVFVFVGDDQGRHGYADRLKNLVAELGIADHVRFAGHCADMPAAYATSEVTLVSSIEPEAFGRTAPEAQAMGSLVVASDLGGAVETVLVPPQVAEAERTGWRVPAGNAAMLADALDLVLNLPDAARDTVKKAAFERVSRSFSLDHMVLQTLGVYDRLLGSGLVDCYAQSRPAK